MIRTRFSGFRTLAQTLTRTTAVLAIAGCASTQSPDRAATSPAAPTAPSATVSTAPDATGIVTYDGYQAAIARSGDTVASVAQRIGMSASELGAYTLVNSEQTKPAPEPSWACCGSCYWSASASFNVGEIMERMLSAAPVGR